LFFVSIILSTPSWGGWILHETACSFEHTQLTEKLRSAVVVVGSEIDDDQPTHLTIVVSGIRAAKTVKLHFNHELDPGAISISGGADVDPADSDSKTIRICESSAGLPCHTENTELPLEVRISGLPQFQAPDVLTINPQIEFSVTEGFVFEVTGSVTITQSDHGGVLAYDSFGYTLLPCEEPTAECATSEGGCVAQSGVGLKLLSGFDPTVRYRRNVLRWFDFPPGTPIDPSPSMTSEMINRAIGLGGPTIDCCPSSVALFDSFKRVLVFGDDGAPGGIFWSNPVEVPAVFWLVAEDREGDVDFVWDQVIRANDIFRKNMAGIRLSVAIPELEEDVRSQLRERVGKSCRFVPGPFLGMPQQVNEWADLFRTVLGFRVALHIFVVDDGMNMSCGNSRPVSDRRVIYLNKNLASLSILTHEIGHAFGLSPEREGGHVDEYLGSPNYTPPERQFFGNNNVMWLGSNVVRNELTIGQVFRFHVHSLSALRRVVPSAFFVNSAERYCHPRDRSPQCPPLFWDVFKVGDFAQSQ
jgi:hypothetical protein